MLKSVLHGWLLQNCLMRHKLDVFWHMQKTAPPVLIFAENKRDVDAIHEYLLVQVSARAHASAGNTHVRQPISWHQKGPTSFLLGWSASSWCSLGCWLLLLASHICAESTRAPSAGLPSSHICAKKHPCTLSRSSLFAYMCKKHPDTLSWSSFSHTCAKSTQAPSAGVP